MIKLQTEVEAGKSKIRFSYDDKILMIGSCFADNIGTKMQQAGFDVCINPFGTLYNPMSIANSINRLICAVPFSQEEVVQMGAGAGLFCSFSHHTSFARPTEEEFLEAANASLERASELYKDCDKVIITLGTAWCYKRDGEVVSNCLKRDAKEFERERIKPEVIVAILKRLVTKASDKKFIFTVSPIRHLKDTAHGNQLSKSSLLLAVDTICGMFPDQAEYFPSYEIMMDELRDYRFYAEDMLHPSSQAVDYIWERFIQFGLAETDFQKLRDNEKLFRHSQHRKMR